jgi:hypothetical protein
LLQCLQSKHCDWQEGSGETTRKIGKRKQVYLQQMDPATQLQIYLAAAQDKKRW